MDIVYENIIGSNLFRERKTLNKLQWINIKICKIIPCLSCRIEGWNCNLEALNEPHCRCKQRERNGANASSAKSARHAKTAQANERGTQVSWKRDEWLLKGNWLESWNERDDLLYMFYIEISWFHCRASKKTTNIFEFLIVLLIVWSFLFSDTLWWKILKFSWQN